MSQRGQARRQRGKRQRDLQTCLRLPTLLFLEYYSGLEAAGWKRLVLSPPEIQLYRISQSTTYTHFESEGWNLNVQNDPKKHRRVEKKPSGFVEIKVLISEWTRRSNNSQDGLSISRWVIDSALRAP